MSAHIETDAAGARVVGAMTIDQASTLLREGRAALAQGHTTFDLAAVSEIDSSGLAVIFGWQRTARQQGRSITLVNAPASLASLAAVYDVVELLPLSSS